MHAGTYQWGLRMRCGPGDENDNLVTWSEGAETLRRRQLRSIKRPRKLALRRSVPTLRSGRAEPSAPSRKRAVNAERSSS